MQGYTQNETIKLKAKHSKQNHQLASQLYIKHDQVCLIRCHLQNFPAFLKQLRARYSSHGNTGLQSCPGYRDIPITETKSDT